MQHIQLMVPSLQVAELITTVTVPSLLGVASTHSRQSQSSLHCSTLSSIVGMLVGGSVDSVVGWRVGHCPFDGEEKMFYLIH